MFGRALGDIPAIQQSWSLKNEDSVSHGKIKGEEGLYSIENVFNYFLFMLLGYAADVYILFFLIWTSL